MLTKDGTDVTAQYEKGAKEALRLARYFGCTAAVLKSRSPSCGKGRIHDGTFSDGMTDGNGVAAELLEACGIRVSLTKRTSGWKRSDSRRPGAGRMTPEEGAQAGCARRTDAAARREDKDGSPAGGQTRQPGGRTKAAARQADRRGSRRQADKSGSR